MSYIIGDDLRSFYNRFMFIKKRGYIKSSRTGSTGVGKTFEDLIGKDEDTSYMPDYDGLEIKTGLAYSKANLKMFNLTPKSNVEYATHKLKDTYGYPDRIMSDKKVLNVTFNGNEYSQVARRYYFKLSVSREEQRVYLIIYNRFYDPIDESVYWEFSELKKRLFSKLRYLAKIDAYDKRIGSAVYYKYTGLTLYRLRGFDEFLDCIERGYIDVSLRVGVYRSGARLGEVHDRGTSFELRDDYMLCLFSKLEV